MSDNQTCIDVCNSLLRGELSAIATYDHALDRFREGAAKPELTQIRAEHQKSCQILTEHIRSMSGTPSEDSGIWGGFAEALEATATLFGDASTLKILKEGEEHGISEYRDALSNDDVMEDIKEQIRSRLIPALETHLVSIARLQELENPGAKGGGIQV